MDPGFAFILNRTNKGGWPLDTGSWVRDPLILFILNRTCNGGWPSDPGSGMPHSFRMEPRGGWALDPGSPSFSSFQIEPAMVDGHQILDSSLI